MSTLTNGAVVPVSQLGLQGTTALIASSVFPSVWQVATAPAEGDGANYLEELTIDGSFITTSLPVGGYVPSTSGVLIHYPYYPDRIWRMGICPIKSGATAFVESSAASSNGLTCQLLNSMSTMNFLSPVAIPYGSGLDAGRAQIRIAPDLSTDLSFLKVISGQISGISDTIGIGSTTLTGRVTTGTLPDTRDVCQTVAGKCFDAADVVQQSAQSKNANQNAQIADGFIFFVGADMSPDFVQPLSGQNLQLKGEFAQVNLGVNLLSNVALGNSTLMGESQYIARTFCTPWNISTGPVPAGAWSAVDVAQTKFGTIAEDGMLVYDIDISWYIRDSTDRAVAAIRADGNFKKWFALEVFADHVFAVVDPTTAQLQFTTISDSKTVYAGDIGATMADFIDANITAPSNIVTAASARRMRVRFDPTTQRPVSFAQTGKYLGTNFVIRTITKAASDGWSGASAAGTCLFNIPQVLITATAPDVNVAGCVGPANVAVFENVGVGQDISINGKLNCLANPSGKLAQYVKGSLYNTVRAATAEAYPLLARLYYSQSPLKNIWILKGADGYEAFKAKWADQMSPELIRRWAQLGGSDVIGLAYQAGFTEDARTVGAGMFSDLLRGAGNAVSGGLGDILGGAANMVGAAGQFRAIKAAGQFGRQIQAGGQFGSYQGGQRRLRD